MSKELNRIQEKEAAAKAVDDADCDDGDANDDVDNDDDDDNDNDDDNDDDDEDDDVEGGNGESVSGDKRNQQKITQRRKKPKSATSRFSDSKTMSSAENIKNACADRRTTPAAQHIETRGGRPYCLACSCRLSNRKQVIKAHLGTDRHAKSLSTIAKEKVIQEAVTHFLGGEASGSERRISDAEMAIRIEFVGRWLAAGIPATALAYIDAFLRVHMPIYLPSTGALFRETIPLTDKFYVDLLKEELGGKPVSVYFDSTPWYKEIFAVVVRYINANFKPVQRLIDVRVLEVSVKAGNKIAGMVKDALAKVNIRDEDVKFITRDGAAENSKATDGLAISLRGFHDIICVSHTLSRSGKSVEFDEAVQFLSTWNQIFSHSVIALDCWKKATNQKPVKASQTRWWCYYDTRRARKVFECKVDCEVGLSRLQ